MRTDTIAAIATAMSSSGIGIIRISGDEAVGIVDRIFSMKNGKKLSDMPTHTIHYGHIKDGDEVIDEVMVVLMRAPKSYTKEDTVEIDCHGGVYVMKRVLETVIKYGARPAEPGEFTKRAFLNGRIDLAQAESVIDIIHAKNEFALKSSISQLQGSLQKEIKELREKITKLGDTPKMCELYRLDPTYRKMVVDQYLVFYRVNDEIKTVEVHRVLRGAWNLPQYLE